MFTFLALVAEEERGIIPRAIQEIFQIISENHNVDFTVKVSYIEVYKEELRDLLELETSMRDLHIREDEKGNTGRGTHLGLNCLSACMFLVACQKVILLACNFKKCSFFSNSDKCRHLIQLFLAIILF